MQKIKNEMILGAAMLNTLFMEVFGQMTILFYLVSGLMLSDLITRIYAAGVRSDETIESRKILKGLYHKLGQCFLIILSLMLDLGLKQITLGLGIHIEEKVIFTNLTLAWLFVREMISSLENLKWAGIEFPEFMMNALGKVKNQVKRVGENDDKL